MLVNYLPVHESSRAIDVEYQLSIPACLFKLTKRVRGESVWSVA